MKKLLVFDLDGTLAPYGAGTLPADAERLRQLERDGYGIVLCSGKPCNYLCGFARQFSLQRPMMVGECGASLQIGVELPPEYHAVCDHSEKAAEQLRMLRQRIDEACGEDIWVQPNLLEVTPFPYHAETFDIIQGIVDELGNAVDEVLTYRHRDCFDFLPNNINKAVGLQKLLDILGMTAEDIIAFGDSINDLPMLDFAGISVGIGDHLHYKPDYLFDTISEALANVENLEVKQ